MPNYLIISILIFAPIAILFAQEDCLNDPSCAHTKSMLLEASRQWDKGSVGINTNHRSDTIDILHYTVTLDMSDFSAQRIDGNCVVRFAPKVDGVAKMQLDLLQMEVDSIIMKNRKLAYSYNDTLLNISFGDRMNVGDTVEVVVFYNGVPQRDRIWGGFYYKGDYAYNLGVGFASDPHNYGRVWHPCFDNFAERATYTFHIKTRSSQRAHCNGYLQAENTVDGFTSRTWKMTAAIPTYLACIAVGDYTLVKQSHEGVNGRVPIELAASAEDTARLKESFQNLKKAIAAYEYWYGAHRWSKVGYSLVPFRSGAMEHATNITYPISAANGTLKREHLMVHELGHSWWGNLVTCETAADMWINEGMASYSEYLFWEYVYGWKRYIKEVKDNHYKVLKQAHQQEGGYRPISGVPHEYTYGMHVYDKGASVAHNMRWYLGDSLFRKGLHYVIDEYQFKNLSSPKFRDALTYSTGVDMAQFFDDWVFMGGFPHFGVAKTAVKKEGKVYKVKVYVRQSLLGRAIYFRKVPLQVTFLDDNWKRHEAVITVSDQLDSATIDVPFSPTTIILNEGHRLNQARFDYQLKRKKTDTTAIIIPLRAIGFHAFKTKSMTDSVWLHLEHHKVAPDAANVPTGCTISSQHYWTVNGILPNAVEMEASLQHDAEDDKDLITYGLDSLILLYRPSPDAPWQAHPNYTKKQTNLVKFSFSLLKGDYAFANGPVGLDIFEAPRGLAFSQFDLKQTDKALQVSFASASSQKVDVELYNQKGERIFGKPVILSKKETTISIPTAALKAGNYFVKIRNSKGRILKSLKVALE